MKNKLKGVTLIETMVYIGLFFALIVIVLNFMLSTQEATLRTNTKSNLFRASELVTQHINYSFDRVLYIDVENSTFGNNLSTLTLVFTEGSKQYYVLNSTLYYDEIPITPSYVYVNSFSLNPIYKEDLLTAIRANIVLQSKTDINMIDTINLLLIIR